MPSINWRLTPLIRPLFLISCALFGLHKLAERAGFKDSWMDSYLDDILVIPIFLGTALFLMRLIMGANYRLSTSQIWITVFIVAVFFETTAPYLYPELFTADWYDLFCYVLGGALFQFYGNTTTSNSNDSQAKTESAP